MLEKTALNLFCLNKWGNAHVRKAAEIIGA
jgi:hypothetical protein